MSLLTAIIAGFLAASAASAPRAICDGASADRALAAAPRARRDVASDEPASPDSVEKKGEGDRRDVGDRKCVEREAGR